MVTASNELTIRPFIDPRFGRVDVWESPDSRRVLCIILDETDTIIFHESAAINKEREVEGLINRIAGAHDIHENLRQRAIGMVSQAESIYLAGESRGRPLETPDFRSGFWIAAVASVVFWLVVGWVTYLWR